jgi:hypothetical protein
MHKFVITRYLSSVLDGTLHLEKSIVILYNEIEPVYCFIVTLLHLAVHHSFSDKGFQNYNVWFSGLLYHVMWCVVTYVLDDRATSIFRINARGESKVDIDVGRVCGGVGWDAMSVSRKCRRNRA